ncbi:MAG: redoxin family protein [Opitutaceae bacterium]
MIIRSGFRHLLVALIAIVAFSAEAVDPAQLEQRLKQLDRNGDGILTREEAGGAAWFDRLDRQGTGSVKIDQVITFVRRLGGERANRALSQIGAPAATTAPAPSPAPAAAITPRQGPKLLQPSDVGVGRLFPDLTFTDLDGRAGKLSDYRSSKALVVALTSTSCPIAKKFAPSLARLENEFGAQGVAFLFVNPAATDVPADIRATIAEHNLRGRTVHDREQKLVTALGAHTSTEVFVFDAARTLVFRGAVDDQYGLGYALDAPRENYLRDALIAHLAGKRPDVPATDAPGCTLDLPLAAAAWPTKSAAAATPALGDVTYHNRISRIIQNNCLECHHTGGVAPFSLATYDEVRDHTGMMRKQIGRGVMPPWFAAPPAEGETIHFKNDRSLAAPDKADLLAWLASDKPLGNPADAPLPRAFPTDWAIGTPDAVIELPRVVAVKADGVMAYQTLRVETKFTEDKWVQAYEVRPTAREVVHHVIVKVRAPGAKARSDADDGRDGFFAAFVPGNSHAIFPAGFAKKIPAGATVSFQMHYTPNGKATTDRTRLGLIFSNTPPRHVIQVAGLSNPLLNIPAGAPNHLETTALTLPDDTTVLSFLPHMHVRGKAARYEAVLPDGTRRRLLDVPAYDFNWQLQYRLAEPITLPRGTRLIYTAWYDNSNGNPANPDATETVRWGPQTFDEMMLGYVEYYVPGREALAQGQQ